ncbi:hypothetical protein DP114_02375 [Brasilonema sennae CENA114]|uniref:Uncharacterized protein n=1 Tax=Brasilonema sennae CENA114 TaxID=415709 RepID=A0A856M947_9CYAN|nr:hypothetical protein [Brasilonema sennae]QDL06904.1 hypothetical protein DP114_02375 [Brasilonema sennae CENA114]
MPWEPDSQSPQRSKFVAWVASPDRLWGNPNALRVRQSPTEGDPLRLRSAPYACGTATPIGASCHNALNPTPFGFASRLRRETLLQRWSHQIPLSGNPHQVLAPSGFTSRLRRETRLQRWIHRKAQLLAALVSPDPSVGKPSSRTGSLRERPSPTAGNPLRLRSAPYACGTATPIGASCHNALNPTPFGFASRLRRETLLQRWSHQIPLSGNPHQVLAPSGFTSRLRRETRLQRWTHQIPLSGNPHQVLAPSGFTSRLRRETRLQRWIHRKAQLLAALDSPQGAALRTEVAHEGDPPAALDSPYGVALAIGQWLPNLGNLGILALTEPY